MKQSLLKKIKANIIKPVLVIMICILASRGLKAGVVVTSPNGGETWAANSTQQITWNKTSLFGAAMVSLSYSIDSGKTWAAINTSAPNSGSYTWTVPNSTSTQCLIEIAEGSAKDASDLVFTISATTGISNNIEDIITVYPNPATGFLTLTNPSNKIKSVMLINTSGQQVYTLPDEYIQNETFNISVSGLAQGIYFIWIKTDNAIINKKILIVSEK